MSMLSKGIFTKTLSNVLQNRIFQRIKKNLFSIKALREFKTFGLKESAGSSLWSICT